MRRYIFRMILCFILSICCLLQNKTTYASSDSSDAVSFIQLDENHYLITELEVITTARSTSKKFGKKTTSLYDKDKTLLASFSVKAYFSVDKGNSVKCTDASCSKTIYVSGWSLTNKSVSADNSSTSKASATAKGTFKNGLKSYKVSATISCTKNGTLS